MKSTPMPGRKQPMGRGKGLVRSGALARSRSTTAKPDRELVRAAVFARDRQCLLVGSMVAGRCFGTRKTPHHLWKGGQGGLYVPANLVTLCAFHNGWVEDHPPEAQAWGLVVRNGDTIPAVWRRMHFWGLLDWWWDGSPADAAMPELEAA